MTPSEAGKWIYTALNVEAVQAIVGDRIYRLSSKAPVTTPWVIFGNIGMEYEPTKDSNDPSEMTARIVCAAQTDDAASLLADAVIAAMNNADDCRVTSWFGDFEDSIGNYYEIDITKEIYD